AQAHPRHGARLRSDSGDGAGTYRAGHGYCTGGDSQATEIAAERGTLLEGHVARRLTPAMVRDYDLILAMELEHIEQVTAIAPEA
ncbi:arsenate reductase/protein-tyrosine-phosphatase family protein, partial [Enterococcus faecium]|uniref:arsenate reductase/protein-tyrosine-phosphatase family protein n=1 Tax=Enterococcus faecium TaxID=1352 RepID=UPI003FA17F2A